jgi:uncharacterized membrane protein
MTSSGSVVSLRQPDTIDDPLTAVLRSGARRLLAQAGRIGGQASLGELTAAIQKLRIYVISSVAAIFVSLARVTTVSVLFSLVFMTQLGLRPSYMSILRISLTTKTFHWSAMLCSCSSCTSAFDGKLSSSLPSTQVLNTMLTIAFLEVGPAFHGYGAMIAAAITFIVALRCCCPSCRGCIIMHS